MGLGLGLCDHIIRMITLLVNRNNINQEKKIIC